MKLTLSRRRLVRGMTIVEMSVALGIGIAILAAFTTASIALQRNFVAIEDYAKGQNDQMRISDYLALDMRRAFDISITGSAANPPLTVTLTVPNYYVSANTAYDPYIVPTKGWPYKKHHHHKHQNIIINQIVAYGPNASTKSLTGTTIQVTYVFNQANYSLTRSVDGAAGTVIATDVRDFNVSISDVDETATTQITFNPRFKTVASAEAIAATTYFQTTLTRNTR